MESAVITQNLTFVNLMKLIRGILVMHFSVLIECKLTENSISAVCLCLVYSFTDRLQHRLLLQKECASNF